MKKFFNPRFAHLWAVLLGGLGFGFQLWLQKSGLDPNGLYASSHPAATLSFLLLPLTLGILLLCVRPLKNLRKSKDSLPEAGPSALFSLAAAAVLLYCGIVGLGAETTGLETLRVWGMLLCGLSAAATGVFALTKKKAPFPVYFAAALFLILFVVGSHRTWSAEPQVLAFLFPLLTCIFLLLNAYQQAALAAGTGHRAFGSFLSSGALFLCLSTLPLGGIFYGGMALWILAQWNPLHSLQGGNR